MVIDIQRHFCHTLAHKKKIPIPDALSGQRGAVPLPDIGGGGRLVFGGRTGGANSNHHIDNIEISFNGSSLWSEADLRVGGGTDRPADGFSFNFAQPDDPVFSEEGGGVGEGWASSPTGDANLPEEGTTTGIAIGFDEWFSGGDPACTPGVGDCVGLSVRVDNEILAEYELPTLNGTLDDPTSLQTGPNTGGVDELGWARLFIHIENIGAGGDYSNITGTIGWKGEQYAIPEPGSGSLLGMGALVFLGILRRHQ